MISDPGFLLIRAKNNIEIDRLPGATAFVPHLPIRLCPVRSLFLKGFAQKKGDEHA